MGKEQYEREGGGGLHRHSSASSGHTTRRRERKPACRECERNGWSQCVAILPHVSRFDIPRICGSACCSAALLHGMCTCVRVKLTEPAAYGHAGTRHRALVAELGSAAADETACPALVVKTHVARRLTSMPVPVTSTVSPPAAATELGVTDSTCGGVYRSHV